MLGRFCSTQIGGTLLALCMSFHTVWAQGVTLPAGIREALTRNAGQMSPITVSWTQQYQSSLRPEEALARFGITNRRPHFFFAKQTQRLTWQAGNIYSWWKESEEVTGRDSHAYECSFDGRSLYHGSPDATLHDGSPQPKLMKQSVQRLAQAKPDTQYVGNDYFGAIGFHVPASPKDLQTSRSGSEILLLLDNGADLMSVEDTEFDGRSVVRVELLADNSERRIAEGIEPAALELKLRAGMQSAAYIKRALGILKQKCSLPEKRAHTFYLDPEIQYAVRCRQERYEDGTLLLQVTNRDFERLPSRDVWLPCKSTVEYYTWPTVPGTYFSDPVLSNVIEASEFGLDPAPAERFVLNYETPRTIICDERDSAPGGSFTYQIPADLPTLDAALERIEIVTDAANATPTAISLTEEGWPEVPATVQVPVTVHSRKGRRRPFIVLNVLVVAGLGVWAAWRHKQRSAADA